MTALLALSVACVNATATQPFGFNPLQGVPQLQRSLAANGIVEALKKMFADSWGYRMEHILRAALLLPRASRTPDATVASKPGSSWRLIRTHPASELAKAAVSLIR